MIGRIKEALARGVPTDAPEKTAAAIEHLETNPNQDQATVQATIEKAIGRMYSAALRRGQPHKLDEELNG